VEWVPPGRSHPDREAALELLEAAGLELEYWQQKLFGDSLLQNDRGKWAPFQVCAVVPRQNGKSELALYRILVGLFVLREPLIIFTAHLADTCMEMFRRLIELIEATPWLASEVKHVWRTNGKEQIELKTGQRVRFRTRTKGGGRGYAKAACVIFDEAMIFPDESHASIFYVVSRSPNPQFWYLGSAVDQMSMEDGQVLTRLRARGLEGGDPTLLYSEWSLEYGSPLDVPPEVLADPRFWRSANPSQGITIEHMEKEWLAAANGGEREFAVERLGVGDWPAIGGSHSVISLAEWDKLADPDSKPLDPVVFSFDASPDRSFASISVAGRRSDGFTHVEVAARERGMGWVVPWLVERVQTHKPAAVVTDASGPAGSLIPELERAGVTVVPVSAPEYAAACGMIYDAVAEQTLRHLADPRLAAAIRGATQRPMSDRWAWSRRNSSVDISPLVSCTLALWGHLTQETAEPFLEVW
jgi:hypothetical protein